MKVNQKDFQAIAVELALEAAGHQFPRLSQVGAGWVQELKGPRRSEIYSTPLPSFPIPATTTDFGIFILDILLARDGRIHLIEANGSNAALSSAVIGRDDKRARHMYLSLMSKGWPGVSSVALMAYAPSLLHIGELFLRAGMFARYLSEDFVVRLANEKENLGDEDIAVICGPIPKLASYISADSQRLYYRGRPVVFASNPNLLPELVRKGIVQRKDQTYMPLPEFQHEGLATSIVHDKGAQQRIAEGTGFSPLEYVEAFTFEDAQNVVTNFVSRGKPVIGKINAGSGGVGIECFAPIHSYGEIEFRLTSMVEAAQARYGADAGATIYPLRFFEFATSTPYLLADGPRLWDFRFQCLVYPGFVDVTPCVIRLCPEPFTGDSYQRGSVVANLTGRPPSLRFMRSPTSMRKSEHNTSVLEALGIDDSTHSRMIESSARWCERALRNIE